MQKNNTISIDSNRRENFSVHGYIKNLESIGFDHSFSNIGFYNLLHNRINIHWQPYTSLKLVAEFRNRMYWGNELKRNPSFGSFLKNFNEGVNMQKLWVSTSNYYLHTNVERLYADLLFKKINIRVGRQRINWGISNTWNPNDIFNSFNFLDVDYEERPGSDALKIKYMSGNFSEIEWVYNATSNHRSISAFRYFFNKWQYDFQLIGGWFKDRITLGIGTAGSIGDFGFKTEAQYFSGTNNRSQRINFTIDFDKVYDKGWYLQYGFLYNSLGLQSKVSNWNLIDLKISPENMMPGKWNLTAGFRKEINPILNIGTSFVYSPGLQLFLLLPRITCSLTENIDADLIWQSFFINENGIFSDVKHIGLIRIKCNF